VTRRLRRTAAVLLVVCAALFIVGVNAESEADAESTEAADDHDEAAETGHDESNEAAGSEVGHDESAEEERILGVDVESPGAVVLAVAVSLALAFGLWIRNQRWLAVAAVVLAVVFAVFDVAEAAHQLDESQTGLVVLAAVIAAGHLAAPQLPACRRATPPDRDDRAYRARPPPRR
jgi:Flp pilus assembly protein TadB